MGCWVVRTFCTSMAILNVILCLTGSQCSLLRTGVICSFRRHSTTMRARVFWARCSLIMFVPEIPCKIITRCSLRELLKPLKTMNPEEEIVLALQSSLDHYARIMIWRNCSSGRSSKSSCIICSSTIIVGLSFIIKQHISGWRISVQDEPQRAHWLSGPFLTC